MIVVIGASGALGRLVIDRLSARSGAQDQAAAGGELTSSTGDAP
ncbi:hypothetical protein [Nonomuraea sp. JJY05]|jgi:uncharacterized protein YbjT (DUF2867 family)